MSLWFLFSLGAALFWGAGTLVVKRNFAHFSSLQSNITANFLGLFFYIPIALIGLRGHIMLPSWNMLLAILFVCTCYMTFLYALQKGKLALTSTIIATYPLITILCSYLFLGERITSFQVIAIIFALAGYVCISLPDHKEKITEYSWLFWGIAAALLQGVGDFMNKVVVNTVGVYENAFWLIVIFQVTSVCNFLLDKSGRTLPVFIWGRYISFILGALLMIVGTLCLIFAFQFGPASLVAPISSSYAVIVVLGSFLFLKERVTRIQLIGIISVIAAIYMISL